MKRLCVLCSEENEGTQHIASTQAGHRLQKFRICEETTTPILYVHGTCIYLNWNGSRVNVNICTYIYTYYIYIYIPVPNVVWEAHACALRSVRGPHGTVSLSVCFRSLHGRFFFGMVEKNNLSGQGLSFYAHDPPQDKHTPQVPAPFARGNCRIPRAFLPG